MHERIADWFAAFLAAHALAVAVVNLTPTPRDNEALGGLEKAWAKVYPAIEILAGILTPLVKR